MNLYSPNFSGSYGKPRCACIPTLEKSDSVQIRHPSLSVFCPLQVGNPRVELTLSELQDMAARQQQQIENQQQMLVAKVSFESRDAPVARRRGGGGHVPAGRREEGSGADVLNAASSSLSSPQWSI